MARERFSMTIIAPREVASWQTRRKLLRMSLHWMKEKTVSWRFSSIVSPQSSITRGSTCKIFHMTTDLANSTIKTNGKTWLTHQLLTWQRTSSQSLTMLKWTKTVHWITMGIRNAETKVVRRSPSAPRKIRRKSSRMSWRSISISIRLSQCQRATMKKS